jgi:hypothetical protein
LTVRKFIVAASLCLLSACADMSPEHVQPIIERKLIGLPISELLRMYGEPAHTDVQERHHVYYWVSLSTSVYTPTYQAKTQGYVGNTPYSGTTTFSGDPHVNVTPCELSVGTHIASDVVERVRLRGFDCGAFLR